VLFGSDVWFILKLAFPVIVSHVFDFPVKSCSIHKAAVANLKRKQARKHAKKSSSSLEL